MRVNKWTWGLATAGLVSLPTLVAQGEEKASPILTALSSTTISGYVDVSAHWNPGSDNAANPAPYIYNQGKSDDADAEGRATPRLRTCRPESRPCPPEQLRTGNFAFPRA